MKSRITFIEYIFLVSINLYKNRFIGKYTHVCTVRGGAAMKRCGSGQVQDLACEPGASLSSEMKCVTVAIFEIEGKTILQPLITEHEAKTIQELFRSKTLEVWLSNGKPGYSVFDVDILKYKQVSQPLMKCRKITNQVCLKNLFESIVCCAQCPLCDKAGGL